MCKFFKNPIKLAFIAINILVILTVVSAKPRRKTKEDTPPIIEAEEPSINDTEPFLVGTETGLYRMLSNGNALPLWTESRVERILKTQTHYYLLTGKGIYRTDDFTDFIECNNGLPSLVVKSYNGSQKQLSSQVHLLKDLCADPLDENILVTATKDAVYLSRNGGESWTSLSSTSRGTPGIKSVACAHMNTYTKNGEISGTELVVFMSHPIYGFSYYRADAARSSWIDVSAGFECMPSLNQTDEVSDILPVVIQNSDGTLSTDIYAANSFLPIIYRFDWQSKRAVKIYQGKDALSTIDSLCQSNGKLIFTTVSDICTISLDTGASETMPTQYSKWASIMRSSPSTLNSAYIPSTQSGFGTALQLSELWLLTPDTCLSPWTAQANNRKALYASAYQLRNDAGITKYKKIIETNKLNAIVVDMKDDYGLLRFTPQSQMLKDKGTVTVYKIDVEHLVEEMKKDNTYLIARIVVFKDRNLASYAGGKYAVWDYKNKKPWIGIKGIEEVLDEEGNPVLDEEGNPTTKTAYYDENWVDPYSEEVWEYNIEIAKELVARGFDEIQFDYIRFPTDGTNMENISFRWKDKGMDKESALISFLSYARQNIHAPIGIDIYGANGWYRSGTRTGQDVELMSRYVDVICPMFYPSHFEQSFLDYSPWAERPYRIYFYGSYRNTVAGRNRIIVRPWVQAFYMGVRYDRNYYNKDYVLREIYGVRDGLNRGYMYWNNSGGNYDDISPDVGDDGVSPWYDNEAKNQTRLPAFSSDSKQTKNDYLACINLSEEHRKAMISIWDEVLNKSYEDEQKNAKIPLLHIPLFDTMKQ